MAGPRALGAARGRLEKSPTVNPAQLSSSLRRAFDLEQQARFVHPRGWTAEFARRNARQRDDVPPAKRFASRREFLRNGPIEFFRMQSAIFADCVPQEQIKYRPGWQAQLSVAMDNSGGPGLKIPANGVFQFTQHRFCGRRLDLIDMLLQWQGLPVLKITAAIRAVDGNLIRAENQAGEAISRVGDTRHVSPGVGGISCMYPNGITVNAADRFARDFLAWRSAHIAQNQLIGR